MEVMCRAQAKRSRRESFGLQSTGDSVNYVYACQAALESAVPQALLDPRTVRHLGGE